MMLSPLLVLQVRADARGYLWHCGEYDFEKAVRPLLLYAQQNDIEPSVACNIIKSVFAKYGYGE